MSTESAFAREMREELESSFLSMEKGEDGTYRLRSADGSTTPIDIDRVYDELTKHNIDPHLIRVYARRKPTSEAGVSSSHPESTMEMTPAYIIIHDKLEATKLAMALDNGIPGIEVVSLEFVDPYTPVQVRNYDFKRTVRDELRVTLPRERPQRDWEDRDYRKPKRRKKRNR